MKTLHVHYSTAILKAPSGRYIVVGSVPVQCLHPDGRQIAFNTESECAQAIESAGITKYQMADCSWNKPKPTKAEPVEVVLDLCQECGANAVNPNTDHCMKCGRPQRIG